MTDVNRRFSISEMENGTSPMLLWATTQCSFSIWWFPTFKEEATDDAAERTWIVCAGDMATMRTDLGCFSGLSVTSRSSPAETVSGLDVEIMTSRWRGSVPERSLCSDIVVYQLELAETEATVHISGVRNMTSLQRLQT